MGRVNASRCPRERRILGEACIDVLAGDQGDRNHAMLLLTEKPQRLRIDGPVRQVDEVAQSCHAAGTRVDQPDRLKGIKHFEAPAKNVHAGADAVDGRPEEAVANLLLGDTDVVGLDAMLAFRFPQFIRDGQGPDRARRCSKCSLQSLQ